MCICKFCNRSFENQQAVRAHLKGCAAYKNRNSQGNSLGSSQGNDSLGNNSSLEAEPPVTCGPSEPELDRVAHLERRLAAERLRLKLRGVEEAHAELDERAQAKTRERERQESEQAREVNRAQREREEARRETESVRIEQQRREQIERGRIERRRAAIQRAKQAAMLGWWAPPGVEDETALRSAILREIEQQLAPLAVEELPNDELTLIAQGARDRLTREAKDKASKAAERASQRERLIRYGINYLEDIEGLSTFERLQLRFRVQEVLGSVRGDEQQEDIEDIVEEMLQAEGFGLDGGDDENEEFLP